MRQDNGEKPKLTPAEIEEKRREAIKRRFNNSRNPITAEMLLHYGLRKLWAITWTGKIVEKQIVGVTQMSPYIIFNVKDVGLVTFNERQYYSHDTKDTTKRYYTDPYHMLKGPGGNAWKEIENKEERVKELEKEIANLKEQIETLRGTNSSNTTEMEKIRQGMVDIIADNFDRIDPQMKAAKLKDKASQELNLVNN